MTHLQPRVGKVSIILALIWLLACPLSASAHSRRERSSARRGVFVSLSDLHFNPLYNASNNPLLFDSLNKSDYREWKTILSSSDIKGYSSYWNDTNYNLLNSTLEYAQQISPHPDFVIISGDFLAHNFQKNFYCAQNEKDAVCQCFKHKTDPAAASCDCLVGKVDIAPLKAFTDKTIAFITMLIEERFPNTPVYPALGNNDSYLGDYNLALDDPFLAKTAQTWKRLIKGWSNTESFLKTFPVNGSYTVDLPGGKGQRLIVLNTVFLSRDYNNCCSSQSAPPLDELSWFEAQLMQASADKKKVWLLSHIPPGIDVYSSKGDDIATYYKPPYNDKFLDLVAQRSPIITYSFAGHTHMDSFQLVNQGIGPVVLITPAISPLFGNNPGFKVFTYDRQTFALIDYSTYYVNLECQKKWGKEYSFDATYRQTSIDPLSLQALYLRMLVDYDSDLKSFDKFYNVGHTAEPAINDANQSAYLCGIGYLRPEQFKMCQQRLRDGQDAH